MVIVSLDSKRAGTYMVSASHHGHDADSNERRLLLFSSSSLLPLAGSQSISIMDISIRGEFDSMMSTRGEKPEKGEIVKGSRECRETTAINYALR
jgi:hypothetical protein